MGNEIKKRLIAGEFLAIEKRAAQKMSDRMPSGEMDWDDALAWVRLYALEAIQVFDPERGKFETFLYAHLRKRGLEMWRSAWSRRRRPESGFCTFTDYAVENDPSSQLEIRELMQSISVTTRQSLLLVLHCQNVELRRSFTKRNYKHTISNSMGFEKPKVESFVQELRREIPKFLSSVGA